MRMIRNKGIQLFVFCVMAVFFLNVTSLTVRAESVSESGENDTMETAETINYNNEKPSGAVDGKHEGQSLITGYTRITDPDWYKVILVEGTNYFTCYGDMGYKFRIINSNGDVVVEDTYSKTGHRYAVYDFMVPSAGYYYIELTGSKSSTQNYSFMIGSPTYQLKIDTIPCVEGSVSMTSGGRAQTVHFDGSALSGLPEDAIASSVTMTDIPLNGTSSVRVTNVDRGLNFTLVKYTWYRDKLISMNLPVDSMWTAEFGYNKVVSFTPALRVTYVYPTYE